MVAIIGRSGLRCYFLPEGHAKPTCNHSNNLWFGTLQPFRYIKPGTCGCSLQVIPNHLKLQLSAMELAG